ncbi:MAG: acetyl-CoA carboxylase biotin carboxyl carrier protein [Xanthobacteraceae bacterium]
MPQKKPALDKELIRELTALLEETGLTEIEVEQAGLRVRVARQTSVAAATAPQLPAGPVTAPAPAGITSQAAPDFAKHPGVVASPMVGTAYLAPEPGARPFVDVGSQVIAGQTLLIIEAMKTMNQIPAPRAGTVIQILVEDSQPVEFGEPLMIVE